MIKNNEEKIILFKRFIKEKRIKYVFDSLKFNISDIDSFTFYLLEEISPNLSFDFKYSLEIILKEAILNAFYHGNFNIDSKIKENDNGFDEFHNLVIERQKDIKYSSRKVYLEIIFKINKIIISIEDEGDGFDLSDLEINNYKNYGRGIKLIKVHSDKIKWNEKGNKITIEKYIHG